MSAIYTPNETAVDLDGEIDEPTEIIVDSFDRFSRPIGERLSETCQSVYPTEFVGTIFSL